MALLLDAGEGNALVGDAGKVRFAFQQLLQTKRLAGLVEVKLAVEAEFWQLEVDVGVTDGTFLLLRENLLQAFLVKQCLQSVALLWQDKLHGLPAFKRNLKQSVVVGFIVGGALEGPIHIGGIHLAAVLEGEGFLCVVGSVKGIDPGPFKVQGVDDRENLVRICLEGWVQQATGLLGDPFGHRIGGRLLREVHRIGRGIELLRSLFGKLLLNRVVFLQPEGVGNL